MLCRATASLQSVRAWDAASRTFASVLAQFRELALSFLDARACRLVRPIFQLLLDIGHELIGCCAIDHAVVEGERNHDDRPDRDGVVDDDGTFFDPAHTHDCNLRLIDDGRSNHSAVLAGIGYAESSILDVVYSQLLI